MRKIVVTNKFNCPFFTDNDDGTVTICNVRNEMTCVGLNKSQCPLKWYVVKVVREIKRK